MDFDSTYLGVALSVARHSKANRRKVGAVLVTKTGVMLPGFNGSPRGMDNACEDENNVTKPSVIHAELNCIMKAAREGVSVVDSTIYVTLSPCIQCAAMLIQAGVTRVVYADDYRDMSGVAFLQEAGIDVSKHEGNYDE
jgi:dCMP deaminase